MARDGPLKSRTTADFRRMLDRLPADIRRAADASYALFSTDPAHPSLQFKPLRGLANLYSARVSLGYRAVGKKRDDGSIVWFWIGSHADYDRLLTTR